MAGDTRLSQLAQSGATDGQVPKWSQSNSRWEPGDAGRTSVVGYYTMNFACWYNSESVPGRYIQPGSYHVYYGTGDRRFQYVTRPGTIKAASYYLNNSAGSIEIRNVTKRIARQISYSAQTPDYEDDLEIPVSWGDLVSIRMLSGDYTAVVLWVETADDSANQYQFAQRVTNTSLYACVCGPPNYIGRSNSNHEHAAVITKPGTLHRVSWITETPGDLDYISVRKNDVEQVKFEVQENINSLNLENENISVAIGDIIGIIGAEQGTSGDSETQFWLDVKPSGSDKTVILIFGGAIEDPDPYWMRPFFTVLDPGRTSRDYQTKLYLPFAGNVEYVGWGANTSSSPYIKFERNATVYKTVNPTGSSSKTYGTSSADEDCSKGDYLTVHHDNLSNAHAYLAYTID